MVFSRVIHLKKIGFKKGYIPWNKGKKTGISPMKGKKHKIESILKIRLNSPREEKSVHWKKENISYIGIHAWVYRKLGKPLICWNCKNDTYKRYTWHNLSGKYLRDIKDWIRLCYKCHYKADRNLIKL